MDRRLHCCAPHEADAVQQRAQIADVEGGLLAVEPDVSEGPLRPFLGGSRQQLLELGVRHADMALSGAVRGHAERIPTSVGRVTLVQALLSVGFSAQLE